MLAKTHILVSFAYGVGLYPAVARGDYTLEQYALLMAGLGVGALLPDIDHPHSIISRWIPFVGGIISRLTTHRGLFHSVVGVFLVFWLTAFPVGFAAEVSDSRAPYSFGAGLMIGYVLHIIADILTRRGTRLFYPLHWNIRLPLFRTGGYREMFLQIGLIVFVVVQLISFVSRGLY